MQFRKLITLFASAAAVLADAPISQIGDGEVSAETASATTDVVEATPAEPAPISQIGGDGGPIDQIGDGEVPVEAVAKADTSVNASNHNTTNNTNGTNHTSHSSKNSGGANSNALNAGMFGAAIAAGAVLLL